MIKIESNIDQERWANMPFIEQMANIGSEVSRTLKWKLKKKIQFKENSAKRVLELLYLTIENSDRPSKTRELTRLRECFLDFIFGNNSMNSTPEIWEKYFNHFNISARQIINK